MIRGFTCCSSDQHSLDGVAVAAGLAAFLPSRPHCCSICYACSDRRRGSSYHKVTMLYYPHLESAEQSCERLSGHHTWHSHHISQGEVGAALRSAAKPASKHFYQSSTLCLGTSELVRQHGQQGFLQGAQQLTPVLTVLNKSCCTTVGCLRVLPRLVAL
jgi:hypothetical protein